MFVLQLNDMRSAKVEILTPVFRAETEQALVEFIKSQGTKPYQDGKWQKVFKKDDVLEWFNPPRGEEIVSVGTKQSWMTNAGIEYENRILSIPLVP